MKPVRTPGRATQRSQELAIIRTPESVAAWIHRYLDALAVKQIRAPGIQSRKTHLAHFNAWCVERGIERPHDVTHAHVEAFQAHLFRYRRDNGVPLTPNSQCHILGQVNTFFGWLVKHRHLPSNPAADLDLPRIPKGLRDPMTLTEIETVMALPDLTYAQGLRDRAILEVFYATGLRRFELAALSLPDIDRERGTLHVRRGKGGKGRFVPVGERALAWIDKYEREARPALLDAPNEPALFLNPAGQRLSVNSLSWRIRQYLDAAGITKEGACHLFRHTMATAMLDNGADVRHVQEMLGHSDITTTQRYTHVSIGKLKAVHLATHPAARLLRDGESPD
ncbi:MAG: tyrosine-type recombinase/integrase [Gammaproteobacteria bacterium]|nr:tyrosine-type recombinase/integrase [Gammaproteobacteria bacterium]